MKNDKAVLVCNKIEYMKIEPVARGNCVDCGEIVGFTKASQEAFSKEKSKHKEYICLECFGKRKLSSEDEFIPISDGQAKEFQDYLRKVGKIGWVIKNKKTN